MSLRKKIVYPIHCLFYFILITLSAQNAFAHGGEKHGSGLAVSLPDVVAKVNDVDINKRPIEKGLGILVHNASDAGKKLSADQQKSAAKKLIDDAIDKELLKLKAKELGVKVSPEQAMKARKPVSILLKEAVLEREIGAKIKIPEADIKSFYEKNKSRFMEKEKVRASIILIKTGPKKGAEGEQAARNKIEKILKKIDEGIDFSLVAKESSQDSLASRGGDLGFFSRDARIPEVFKKYAFNLEVGGVSEVFNTRHGLHLLKVTGKKPGGLSPIEKENEKIGNLLKLKEINKRTPEYIQALRKKAKVQTYF